MEDFVNTTLFQKQYWKRSSFNVNLILPIYGIILLICIVGNTLVCATIIRNREMRSRWYFLLLSLSIADMGFALATPIQLIQFVSIDLGDAGCKSGIFILDIFLGVSLLSLAFISLDRYFGICHGTSFGSRTARAIVIVPLIWLAAAVVYLPMAFACGRSKVPGSLTCDCHSKWPKQKYYVIYSFFITLVIYLIPFISMAVCYVKICRKLWGDRDEMIAVDPTGAKRKSVVMLIATTMLFFVAWTPYNCLYILKKLEIISPKVFGKLFLFAEVLAFANSAGNPFVYCIFSRNFREGFKKCCCCWNRRRRRGESVYTRSKIGAFSPKRERERSREADTGYGGSISQSKSQLI